VIENNKNMRVELTRLRVIENSKTMRVKSTRVRVKSTRMRVVKITTSTKIKLKKAKHWAGACRSKVYVYYYEFIVIF
jgi:hypothetical protein